MTLRKLLTNLPLYALCLGLDGADTAARAADAFARAVVAGDPIELAWTQAWSGCAALDCVCLPHDSAPVAPACAND